MRVFLFALLIGLMLMPSSLIAQPEIDFAKTVPLVAYRKGQVWGYADTSGIIKISPQFDRIDQYYIEQPLALISVWKDGKLRKRNIASHFYSEYKFKSTTWYGFFEQHIVPTILWMKWNHLVWHTFHRMHQKSSLQGFDLIV